MFDLYKRDKQIGTYSSMNSARIIANRLRGEERAQRFVIVNGRRCWEAMLPPKGKGRAQWRKSQRKSRQK